MNRYALIATLAIGAGLLGGCGSKDNSEANKPIDKTTVTPDSITKDPNATGTAKSATDTMKADAAKVEDAGKKAADNVSDTAKKAGDKMDSMMHSAPTTAPSTPAMPKIPQ